MIVFSTYQTDPRTAQIVAVQADGSGRRDLGAASGHPWGPRLSPDGTALLFSSAAPSSAAHPIDNDLNGSGSPDIWSMGIGGAGAQRLTAGSAGYNGWAWSPDGRWIAFASNRGGSWEIYKMTAAGTELTRLTTTPAQDAWPAWTPDGAGIIFASTRSDRPQLYRMDADGRNVRRLLASQTADTEPAVAPDGSTIAFSAQAADGLGEIYLVGRDGSAPRRLTAIGGLNNAPRWSPNGNRLVFANHRDGHSDLYTIGKDGTGLSRITSDGINRDPDWGILRASAHLDSQSDAPRGFRVRRWQPGRTSVVALNAAAG